MPDKFTALAGLVAGLLPFSGGQDVDAGRSGTWLSGDVVTVRMDSDGPADMSSLRLILPTGKLYEDVGSCGSSHLFEHLVGRSIALRDAELAKFGYRVDGFTGPGRIVISIDVGGGLEGVRAAAMALSEAVARPLATQADVAAERRAIASEGIVSAAAGPMAALASFVPIERREVLLGHCGAKAGQAGLPKLPPFAGAPQLFVWSKVPEAALRTAMIPIRIPGAARKDASLGWTGTRAEDAAARNDLAAASAITLFATSAHRVTPEIYRGYLLLLAYAADGHRGMRVAVTSLDENSLLGSLETPEAAPLASRILESARALADGRADPRRVARADTSVRDGLCRRVAAARQMPPPLIARRMALAPSARLEDELARMQCSGSQSPGDAEQVAKAGATHFLNYALLRGGLSAAAPTSPSPPYVVRTVRLCLSADAGMAAAAIGPAALIVQRQLGYALRFNYGSVRRLTVAPQPEAGRACLGLTFEGETLAPALTDAAVEQWVRGTGRKDFSTQFCFDVRSGAGGDRPTQLEKFAQMTSSECIDAIKRINPERMLVAMKLEK